MSRQTAVLSLMPLVSVASLFGLGVAGAACAPGSVDGSIDGDTVSVSSVASTLREAGEPNLLVVSLSEAPMDREALTPADLVDAWTASLQVFAPSAGTFEVSLEVPGVIAGAQRARTVSCEGDDFVLDDVQTILADDGSVTLDVDPEIGRVVTGGFELNLNGEGITGTFRATVVDEADVAETVPACVDEG